VHLIKENKIVAEKIGKMIVEAPYAAEHRKAGQFIILRIDEYGERIPLTIADADKNNGTITLYYQVVGKTTMHMSRLIAGEHLRDIAGPLGHPTEIEKYGTVVCIGGGIGIAPVFPISTAMKNAGNRVINIIGARNKNLLILEDELTSAGDEIIVCTDDGSSGRKAFVTGALQEIIDREPVHMVVAVGPIPMMKAVSELTRDKKIKTLVSLNSIMVDGTGMCGGCRVSITGEKKFTCVDGPEFDAHTVDFDELMVRLSSYKENENTSMERYEHKCQCAAQENK
jgi:NAD(P)H-flavin reductase